jgi:ubiquinone/menaquinone biosynthesis C-methylase UbiE
MVEWNQILQRKEYSRETPDEIVINFAQTLKRRKAKRVLDLGCGAGRHIIHLATQGFEMYGADISETGLKLTKKRLKSRKLKAEILKCDMKSMPYADFSFNAVVCVKTIYHQRLKEIQKTISEVHRVLKEKGLFLVDFQSKRSSKYGKGIKVEENTFMQESGPEKGVLHHFVNENELCRLLKGFSIVDLKAEEEMIKDYLRSHIIVLAEKTSS